MVVSLLVPLHRHCPRDLWRHLIETDHYKRTVDHYNWRIFSVFRYGRSVPCYLDQYNRLIFISVITTSELLVTRTGGISPYLDTGDPFHAILISATA
ncbi:hypothetical protein AVEN_117682-1 [Araneus ventricosus]|uniref:Uncharacterized protein n=1 Tax=Araneus ventricosus TaxID=182803 RepID=A0A4Y2P5V9_ARAVE|nr:hypothetical protein AVEN_117682-1 [Araneus ventricosus]